MFSSSKKWTNPTVQIKQQQQKLNNSRFRLCRFSEAWPEDYDIENHRRQFNEDLRTAWEKKSERKYAQIKERKRLGLPQSPENDVKPALGGKEFGDNFSSVLAMPTVFTHEWEAGRVKPIPDWPSKAEAKYEGDERISTDKLHGRFLGAPRVQGNDTVNWQQRSIIQQYPLEDFYYPIPTEVDVFMRSHRIQGREFTDQEGEVALGQELMEIMGE